MHAPSRICDASVASPRKWAVYGVESFSVRIIALEITANALIELEQSKICDNFAGRRLRRRGWRLRSVYAAWSNIDQDTFSQGTHYLRPRVCIHPVHSVAGCAALFSHWTHFECLWCENETYHGNSPDTLISLSDFDNAQKIHFSDIFLYCKVLLIRP